MNNVLTPLFTVLDTLGQIARMMHPRRLPELIAAIGDQDAVLAEVRPAQERIAVATTYALQACAGLRAAPDADNPMVETFRALRQYSRALEALAGLIDTLPEVGCYFLEAAVRDDPAFQQKPGPDSGIFHLENDTNQRGGFSVIVPPLYNPVKPASLIMALHGGSGHGRQFLWNWLPEARSRSIIVIAPTAIGSTWSLMDPDIDSQNLQAILTYARNRWNIDPAHMLLTGMSDGGTFTLLSGLDEDSPFTHLAPVAASFHPMLLAMTSPHRLTGLPIHLTHGAQDWMFPVSVARTAHRALSAAGAAIVYREIADLSHAYPRDGQGEVLDWFIGRD